MTPPKQNKDALGKGIRSLLQSIDSDLKTPSGSLKSNVVEQATHIQRIPVADIEPNPKQPRRDFEEQALNELSASIKMHDIIQPLTVSPASLMFRLISARQTTSSFWNLHCLKTCSVKT
jgi:ParB family transcriptional regulator, chromosome partitioning protein